MNSSIFHIFFMIVLCCLLASAASTKTSSLVILVCKHICQADPENVSYPFCISTFGSDSRSQTSTAPQLAQIPFELGIAKAKAITVTIHKLLELSSSDPVAKNALQNCSGVYSRVPGDLKAGLEALKGGDLDTASSRASAVMNAAATCGNGIKELSGKVAPLTQEINYFHQLGAISLGFTKLLRIMN